MKKMLLLAALCVGLAGCEDNAEHQQQESTDKVLQEMNNQIGMPNIRNFQEKKLLKLVLEERDKENLVCYAYIVAEQSGKLNFIGKCIGYGIPYSTEYTNPQKREYGSESVVAQADPNGLYMPSSSEGTWLFMVDPSSNKPRPVYCEGRTLVSPFPITNN